MKLAPFVSLSNRSVSQSVKKNGCILRSSEVCIWAILGPKIRRKKTFFGLKWPKIYQNQPKPNEILKNLLDFRPSRVTKALYQGW